jgi:nicotinamidase-related amidase
MGDIDLLYDAARETADELRAALAAAVIALDAVAKSVPDHLWTDALEEVMASAAVLASEVGIDISW